jgi:hypothetical protein
VDAHLDWCDGCSEMLADLRLIRRTLRLAAPGRTEPSVDETTSLQAAIVSRAGAESKTSWASFLRESFDDMHLIYAGLGALSATVACLMIMLSMMRFAELVAPGSNQNPVVVDARMLMPRALDGQFYAVGESDGASDDDQAFTVSGVVTREGRLKNLEMHQDEGQAPAAGSREARAVEVMLGAMSQARFEPARVAGLPIAVNMVWLVEHTTVRADKLPLARPATPAPKKRRVDAALPPAPLRAPDHIA